MSRLRATLSESPVDKAIAAKVAEAQRTLQGALQLFDYRTEPHPGKRRRMLGVRRDLEQALGALSSVRRIGSLYDMDDPDLNPASPPRQAPPKPVPVVVATPEE